MSVHFKFKSAKKFDQIPVVNNTIKCYDLKCAIVKKKKMRGLDFDLELTNAQTHQKLNENDAISRNSAVLVKRVPVSRHQRTQSLVQRMTDSMQLQLKEEETKSLAGTGIGSSVASGVRAEPAQALVKSSAISARTERPTLAQEAAHLQDIAAASDEAGRAAGRGSGKGSGRGRGRGRGKGGSDSGGRGKGRGGIQRRGYSSTLREFQMSPRTLEKHIREKTRQPKGVPKKFLDSEGFLAASRDKFAASAKVFISDEDVLAEAPEHLKCPLSGKLLFHALLLPCCGKSVDDQTIQTILMENSFMCPLCHTTNVTIDKLLPNPATRSTVTDFVTRVRMRSVQVAKRTAEVRDAAVVRRERQEREEARREREAEEAEELRKQLEEDQITDGSGSAAKRKLRRRSSSGGKTPRTALAEQEFGGDLFATDTPRCMARKEEQEKEWNMTVELKLADKTKGSQAALSSAHGAGAIDWDAAASTAKAPPLPLAPPPPLLEGAAWSSGTGKGAGGGGQWGAEEQRDTRSSPRRSSTARGQASNAYTGPRSCSALSASSRKSPRNNKQTREPSEEARSSNNKGNRPSLMTSSKVVAPSARRRSPRLLQQEQGDKEQEEVADLGVSGLEGTSLGDMLMDGDDDLDAIVNKSTPRTRSKLTKQPQSKRNGSGNRKSPRGQKRRRETETKTDDSQAKSTRRADPRRRGKRGR